MKLSLLRASQALLALLVLVRALSAHELNPAVADLEFGGGKLSAVIEMNLESLMAGVSPSHEDTDDSPEADVYKRLRALPPETLLASFDGMAAEFAQGITALAGETRIPLEVVGVQIPQVGDTDLARLSRVSVAGPIPQGAEAVSFGWSEAFGQIVVRTSEAGEGSYAALLSGGEMSGPIRVEGPTERGFLEVLTSYVGVGFEHIVPLGLDHILFVVGLFLLSTHLRPLLWQVTSFTLAHTVTLALGVTGVLAVPASVVEPVIAASIVYVAVENIARPTMSPWRPVVVFFFGLLHGLGFAGVLEEWGLPEGQFAAGLIGFNLGVELGQLTVIAACFALVGFWFGDRPWYRRVVVVPGSAAVAVIGAYWFLQRTVL